MTDGSLKPTRHYPVISIDVAALRAAGRPFELESAILDALRAAAGGKPVKARAWAREAAGSRTFVYLVTPRGGGGLASALVAALTESWPDGRVRAEGSLPPTGGERLLLQVDGAVAHRAPAPE